MDINKYQKLVFNLYNKENWGIHVRALKQTLDYELKSMIEAIHNYEHRIQNKSLKWFWGRLQADEQFFVWEDYKMFGSTKTSDLFQLIEKKMSSRRA